MSTQDVQVTDVADLQAGDVIVTPLVGDGGAALVRRQVPDPLPARPGYYVAASPSYGETTVVELLNSPAGQWVDAGDGTYLDEETVRAMGELVPLARVDEIIAAILNGSSLNGGIPIAAIEEIAARYGVTR